MSTKKLSSYPFFSFIHPDTRVKFSALTKGAGLLSVLLVAFSAYQYFGGHWKYGIDFEGGLDIQVRFREGVKTDAVRDALSKGGVGDAAIQAVNAEGIRTGEVASVAPAPAADTATGTGPAEGEAAPEAAAAADKTVAPEGGDKPAEPAAASTEAARPAGEGVNLTGPEYIVKVKMKGEDIADQAETVRNALAKGFGSDGFEVLRQEGAGPAAVKDLSSKAVESVVYAMFFMFLYVLIRFSQLDFASAVGFGTGAVVATLHDIVAVMALFVVFGYEFSLPVLAAFLTVVGYSVNDTIVVFDRIREKLAKHRTADLWELFDQCASETLTRTTITAGTTAISAGALLIFGGGVIHDFAFVMLWGVIFGTYSSIFVASPVFILVTKWLHSRSEGKGEKNRKVHRPAKA